MCYCKLPSPEEDICPNRSCTWNNIPSASTLTFDSAFALSHLSVDVMSWSELEQLVSVSLALS